MPAVRDTIMSLESRGSVIQSSRGAGNSVSGLEKPALGPRPQNIGGVKLPHLSRASSILGASRYGGSGITGSGINGTGINGSAINVAGSNGSAINGTGIGKGGFTATVLKPQQYSPGSVENNMNNMNGISNMNNMNGISNMNNNISSYVNNNNVDFEDKHREDDVMSSGSGSDGEAKRELAYKKQKGMEEECIGFATLPDQVYRRVVKGGFYFTIMVAGESGLGKSTLVNSLFLTDLYKDRELPGVEERVQRTTQISRKTMSIEENGVKLKLTIVDTPGFGDAVNGHESWRPVERYINEQFDQYFKDESGLNRKNIVDNRVHCCLYFVSPYGHGLRPIDVQFMRQMHHKVNIIPVIAKADVLTDVEMAKLKHRIMKEIEEHNIDIYQFPECDPDEDEDVKRQDSQLKAAVPFSVIGSNGIFEVNGKRVRGRLYPWGIVEVDNPGHCDFTKLRTMLISSHMQDLKDVTRDMHYESYRSQCISRITQSSVVAAAKDAAHRHSRMTRNDAAMTNGHREQGEAFDTDKLIQEKEEELRRMQEKLRQMQQQLHQQNQQVEAQC